MNSNSKLAVFILMIGQIFGMSACSNSRNSDEQNLPAALQEKSSINDLVGYSSRSYDDLIEQLFNEIKENRSDVAEIAEAFDAKSEQLNKELDLLYKFDGKSTQYYGTAEDKLSSITDSILSAEMAQIVGTSKSAWTASLKNRDALAEKLRKNAQSLEDQFMVLKIRLTMPQIEAYQKEKEVSLLSGTEFEKTQRDLLQKMQLLKGK